MSDTKTETAIPSSPLRRHEFDDGDTTVLARYATLIPGDPDRLFLFAARELEVRGVEITPPCEFDEENDFSEMHAYYVGDEENVIVYFLENFADGAATGFAECYLILELHELTHWAIPEEDNEQDPGHWERWNRVLTDVTGYVMDVEDWDVTEYDPPEGDREPANPESGRQATLEDVITS